jgi:hypothetical protein
MIHPLRAVHCRAFVALALVLPAILFIGLGARRPLLGPSVHASDVADTGNMVWESSDLWQKHAIRSRFYRKSDRPQDLFVVLQPSQDLNEPDLLLYWLPMASQGNALQGKLVGAFSPGKAFVLPLNEERAGYLVLFSPAHQILFDTAKVEKLP